MHRARENALDPDDDNTAGQVCSRERLHSSASITDRDLTAVRKAAEFMRDRAPDRAVRAQRRTPPSRAIYIRWKEWAPMSSMECCRACIHLKLYMDCHLRQVIIKEGILSAAGLVCPSTLQTFSRLDKAPGTGPPARP
jgi:hypothetical protein